MINLLHETLQALDDLQLGPSHVQWVGTRDGRLCTDWNGFVALANRDYDDGYGSPEVRENLVVVGCDWWLTRWEYDGSEGWEFNRKPRLHMDRAALDTVWADDHAL